MVEGDRKICALPLWLQQPSGSTLRAFALQIREELGLGRLSAGQRELVGLVNAELARVRRDLVGARRPGRPVEVLKAVERDLEVDLEAWLTLDRGGPGASSPAAAVLPPADAAPAPPAADASEAAEVPVEVDAPAVAQLPSKAPGRRPVERDPPTLAQRAWHELSPQEIAIRVLHAPHPQGAPATWGPAKALREINKWLTRERERTGNTEIPAKVDRDAVRRALGRRR
jgi:hypothetical protein